MSLSCSRRTFLRRGALAGAAASAISIAPWLLEPDAAVAQDLSSSGIATFIGKGLASGVVGAIGGMAFGKIMAAMGVDVTGQAAMAAKLDEILAKLDQLQDSVKSMQSFLDSELSEIKYDASYSTVSKLIHTNATIIDFMQTLLKVDAKAHPVQAFDLKNKIEALVRQPDYQIGPKTWHDALVGGNGQTSLLRAWGSVIFNQEGVHFFDSSQAAKIQARWECFDAQQAMTVWCLVEGYNGAVVPQPELAMSTLEEWWANRKVQLGVLRGCVNSVDTFEEVVNGKSVPVTTKMNCLPPDTLYSKATQKLWMLTPYGPVNTAGNAGELMAGYVKWTSSSANKTGIIGGRGVNPITLWETASDDDIVKLGLECGGSLGPGHDRDTFAYALQQHGFRISDPAHFKVAGMCRYRGSLDDSRSLCNVFVEGDSWDPNGSGPAYFLSNRAIFPGDKFFYTS
jgi:hypothetical protein